VSANPSGPFVDASTAPFICQPALGGSIDPSVFVDDSGQRYLIWKSDGDSIGLPSHIWSVAINDDLDDMTGSPTSVLTDDQPWQDGIVENPDMVEGERHL
jgi:arabinan endo-1,5-alpha-L-arabinosidase